VTFEWGGSARKQMGHTGTDGREKEGHCRSPSVASALVVSLSPIKKLTVGQRSNKYAIVRPREEITRRRV